MESRDKVFTKAALVNDRLCANSQKIIAKDFCTAEQFNT